MSNELAHTMNNWSHCDNPDFVMVPATTAPLCFPFLAKLFVLVPFHSAVSGWTKQGVKGIPGVHCRLNGHAMQTPLFADHLLSLEEKGVSPVVPLGRILLLEQGICTSMSTGTICTHTAQAEQPKGRQY